MFCDAKNTSKQGCFCYFIPNLTLNKFQLGLLSQFWQNLPLFLENGHFGSPRFQRRPPFLALLEKQHFQTPKHERILPVVLKKDPLLRVFYTCISEWPPMGLNRSLTHIVFKNESNSLIGASTYCWNYFHQRQIMIGEGGSFVVKRSSLVWFA